MISIHADWFGYRLPARKRYRMIRQAGFDAALLFYRDDFGQARRKRLYLLARRAGLYIENVHAPFDEINHIWRDTPEGQRVFVRYLRCAEDCARFGIPTMVMHPARGRTPPPVNEIGLERFRQIVRRAEELGVNVAMENLCQTDKIERAAWLLEQIGSPRFGLCFDAGHFNARTSETDLLARFGHRLMALHLHDNEGPVLREPGDDQHRLPFDGTADWPALMKMIAGTGYQGPVALEVNARGPYYENVAPEDFLSRAYERAKRLEALLRA
ncbi:MAG: sugar phosphate isomerase/epimerase [Oscillospiraceae bacterium]|jgi:sugar phosphate isomerase/epimerase|nr:sugar phosphate isomerase/epimerase [Oscillospiraceae bacterium]